MKTDELKELRERLVNALSGGESHIKFEKVLGDLPENARGAKPEGAPHSIWELVEHLRIAQRDILDYVQDAKHESPKFPEGYWPKTEAPASRDAWDQSLRQYEQDGEAFAKLVETEDLFKTLGEGAEHTLLREALVLANHNSYHLGQIAFLRRWLER